MREVEEREIRSYKCPMCGSRNKRYHDICYKTEDNKIGYHYRCCNCGTETTSTNPDINIESIPKKDIICTSDKCFIVTGCRNFNCPLNIRTDIPSNFPDHSDIPGNESSGSGDTNNTKITEAKSVSPAELRINAARFHEGIIPCDKFR